MASTSVTPKGFDLDPAFVVNSWRSHSGYKTVEPALLFHAVHSMKGE